jgi:hypothetical protein
LALWKLLYSETINAYINSKPQIFSEWTKLNRKLNLKSDHSVRAFGKLYLEERRRITTAVAKESEDWLIGRNFISVVNAPFALRSFVCERILINEGTALSGAYSIKEGKAIWSLRSKGGANTITAASIAERFPGGGGHQHSAGFTISISQMDFINRAIKIK